MLEAERALAVGLLDQAEQLYGRVASADPKNSIAIVGLARVALERGDQRGAYVHARRALALDPDNPMASHLVMRMAELMRRRGEEVPADEAPAASATSGGGRDGGGPSRGATSGVPGGPAVGPDRTGPTLLDRLFRRGR